MSEGVSESLKRAPFANYDIVVYFGGGLFAIPFINRYIIEPFQMRWPTFKIPLNSSIASEAVAILSSLFFIYILGHMIAYIGSQLIEKLVDRILGKISTSIIMATEWSPKKRNTSIRAIIWDRVSSIKKETAVAATICRVALHLPAIPVYIAVYFLGIFGYYETRITKSVVDAAREKINLIGLGAQDITIRSKWYKPLEYFVINRYPNSVPRMYNYLVISGLFRSLGLIFLFGMWSSLYYISRLSP